MLAIAHPRGASLRSRFVSSLHLFGAVCEFPGFIFSGPEVSRLGRLAAGSSQMLELALKVFSCR